MATTKTIQPTGTTITIPAMTDRPDASVFATDVDRITDAVNAENQALTNLSTVVAATKDVFVQLFNQTIAGSASSVSTTTFNLSSYVPSGYSIWSAEVQIQDGAAFYNLPWFNDNLTQATWIERITNASIIIKNKASWSANTSVTFTLHCKKN